MLSVPNLRKQVLFQDIEEEHLGYLAGILKAYPLKKGEFLFKEGDVTKGLYLVHSGKIEISKTTPDGWRQTLAVITPGNFFGELALIEKRNHQATAKAIENTDLIKLLKEDFERMEKENAAVAMQIVKKLALVMSNNLRRMNERFLNALISY